MVNREKYNKGHKAMKKLQGAEHENMKILRECVNELYEKAGVEKPGKLNMLNELFNS